MKLNFSRLPSSFSRSSCECAGHGQRLARFLAPCFVDPLIRAKLMARRRGIPRHMYYTASPTTLNLIFILAGQGFRVRGREIASPINKNEGAATHENQLLKDFASLGTSEHCLVGRTDRVGMVLIEPLAHLGIAG